MPGMASPGIRFVEKANDLKFLLKHPMSVGSGSHDPLQVCYLALPMQVVRGHQR
jgi:hypothetical protein